MLLKIDGARAELVGPGGFLAELNKRVQPLGEPAGTGPGRRDRDLPHTQIIVEDGRRPRRRLAVLAQIIRLVQQAQGSKARSNAWPTQADVGIALGTGTDVAIEAAEVTLMSGGLDGVVTAIALSRSTMRNIRQNLRFAFDYNAAGIPLAAGILYPFTGWLLSPIIAAAAMAASSLSVVGNSSRLRRFNAPTLGPSEPAAAENRPPVGILELTPPDRPLRLTGSPPRPQLQGWCSGALMLRIGNSCRVLW